MSHLKNGANSNKKRNFPLNCNLFLQGPPGPYPWLPQAMMGRNLGAHQLLSNLDGSHSHASPIFCEQRPAQSRTELGSPDPIHAVAISLNPIPTLLPGHHRGLDRAVNLIERQNDESGQVAAVFVGLGLAHQLADCQNNFFGQPGPFLSGPIRVDDPTQ